MTRAHFFILLLTLLIVVTASNQYSITAECFISPAASTPTIGQFEAPAIVYANKYFSINATINHPSDISKFVNVTIEVSHNIILKWDNATDTFSEYNDPNNYCTLATALCVKTQINSTAYKLSWKIKLGWNYPEGSVSIIETNTTVYDSTGASGSGSQAGLFTFEDDLVVASASVDDSRVNPEQAVVFSGTVYYEGTNIPPANGNGALSFDGVDDYVDLGNVLNFGAEDSFSISLWEKTNDCTKKQRAVNKGHLDDFPQLGNEGYEAGWIWQEKICAQLQDANRDIYLMSSVIESNLWYHTVLTVDRSVNIAKLYVNGEDVDSKDISMLVSFSNIYPLRIGTYSTNPFYSPFDGVIDEVRIYNRVLSAEEVSEHYHGIYRNETGLVLYLDFDGDVGNSGKIHGSTWTDGYANIEVKVELEGALKQTVSLVNTTNGAFVIPSVTAESNVGKYDYTIYTENALENQTVSVIVDRIKITKGATDKISVLFVGEEQTLWFIAVYEFDNSTFDGTCGMLYMNGSAMEWSLENERWEYKYVPDAPGVKNYSITGVLDMKYGLSVINDVAGTQTITVHTHWYEPIVWLINSPYFWVSISIIILILLFRFRIIEVKIEKSPKSY